MNHHILDCAPGNAPWQQRRPSELPVTPEEDEAFAAFPSLPPERHPTATEILAAAAQHMIDRAATYDKPEGERSMPRAVAAFNAISGHTLTSAQGWLLMICLKLVRDQQRACGHKDSIEDAAAYVGLYGEDRL